MTGKTIICEGLEGAGKSSIITHCSNILEKSGIKFVGTREPGGTPLAEEIRNSTKKNWAEKVLPETELMLMYASRLQLLENVIKPALREGNWVLGDRHDWSSIAYQGGGRCLSDDVINALRNITLNGFEPDLIIYLDVDPEVGLERARGRGELDRFEKQDLEFFQRTRKRYLELAESTPHSIIIDAGQDIENVKKDVAEALLAFIQDDI